MKRKSFIALGCGLVIAVLLFMGFRFMQKDNQSEGSVLFQDFESDEKSFSVGVLATGELVEDGSLKYDRVGSGDPQVNDGSITILAEGGSVDVSQTDILIFSIKDTTGSNTLKLSLEDTEGNQTPFDWQAPQTTENEWVHYHVPLSRFSGIDLTKLAKITIGQWNEGSYYLDNVYFSNQLPQMTLVKPIAEASEDFVDFGVVKLVSQHVGYPMYYTLDGSEPTKDSLLYTGMIRIDRDTTLKAVVYNPDYDDYSEVASFDYTVEADGKTYAPKAQPGTGTYALEEEVTLTTTLADATIFYTLDGTEPTEASDIYEKPLVVTKDTVIKAIAVNKELTSEEGTFAYRFNTEEPHFLKAEGTDFRNRFGSGDRVVLKGINAGGWLIMEEWMSPVKSPNQLTTIKTLTERFGEETAWELLDLFQDQYFQAADFDKLAEEGVNSIRLPFSYFEMMNKNGTLKETAFERMDWFIEEAAKREIYVVLVMHGAPGSQNGKDHSGDTTYPDKGNLYGNTENRANTEFLWTEIAKRYKEEPWVAGYDLLNEPGGAGGFAQFSFYDRLYQAVREVDPDHIIFIEAIWEPMDLPNPKVYEWENVAYSYHFYQYNDPHNFDVQKSFTDAKVRFVEETNHGVPVYVGEFTGFDNLESWDYILNVYEEQGWSYASWTYKVTGLNSSWGFYTGSPSVVDIELDSEEQIRTKWSNVGTDTSYQRNDSFADILQRYFMK